MVFPFWILGLILLIGSFLAVRSAEDQDLRDTILSATYVEMIVATSWSVYSDSTDLIEATFHGELSTSGPHPLGPYLTRGETMKQNITLDRYVGPLKYIQLQNRGHDGWLPSRISCIYDRYLYNFNFPKTWLNSFDYDSFLEERNGYEPRVQQNEVEVNSAEVMVLEIRNSVKLNSLTGNRPEV